MTTKVTPSQARTPLPLPSTPLIAQAQAKKDHGMMGIIRTPSSIKEEIHKINVASDTAVEHYQNRQEEARTRVHSKLQATIKKRHLEKVKHTNELEPNGSTDNGSTGLASEKRFCAKHPILLLWIGLGSLFLWLLIVTIIFGAENTTSSLRASLPTTGDVVITGSIDVSGKFTSETVKVVATTTSNSKVSGALIVGGGVGAAPKNQTPKTKKNCCNISQWSTTCLWPSPPPQWSCTASPTTSPLPSPPC